jgi:hypothetical protein
LKNIPFFEGIPEGLKKEREDRILPVAGIHQDRHPVLRHFAGDHEKEHGVGRLFVCNAGFPVEYGCRDCPMEIPF